jgi:hypothetical protein
VGEAERQAVQNDPDTQDDDGDHRESASNTGVAPGNTKSGKYYHPK